MTERRGQGGNDHTVSRHHTAPCRLPLLQPIRHCLHPFLSSVDAVRLMATSESITACLLTDYSFVELAFHFLFPPTTTSIAQYGRYARYRMRVLRMCVREERVDGRVSGWPRGVGLPPLPSSLVSLAIGSNIEGFGSCIVEMPFDGSGDSEYAYLYETVCEDAGDRERQLEQMAARWERNSNCNSWTVLQNGCGSTSGGFNHPIPPAALPSKLRLLQLNDQFNQPLQVGSIPDTVEVLQFGACFNQPLAVGHLPASLTHLNFGYDNIQPLLPGVLPAGLKRLHLSFRYNHPLQPDVLPPQLQELCFEGFYNHPLPPGAIPTSVIHLRLSRDFDHPLQVGSIPHIIRHLNLGDSYNRPLLPGVLPTSLRELIVGRQFNQPLQPGSLPDRLEVLAFISNCSFQQPLQPGVIPLSVRVLNLCKLYRRKLVAGSIPAGVRWLRLSTKQSVEELSGVVSASTRVVRWQ